MAFPVLLKKLFKNEGAGPELRDDIIPKLDASKLPEDYLPKSGGTVNGAVTIQHGYRGLTQKLPSNSTYTDHAFLDQEGNLYGNIRVTKNAEGATNIGISTNGKDASGGTTWRTLEIGANSDGSSPFIKFNGDAILTRITGLPLTGGTMTGTLKTSSSITKSNDSSYLDVTGATAWNKGAYLSLSGKDSDRGGRFDLSAHDGTNNKVLVGKPDGTLTWGNNNIVRSVNGTSADANGNVSVDISLTKDKVVNALGYTPPTTNTTYSSGTGISIGTDNKVNLATVVTAGNGGPTADASPGFGGTFTVPYFTYDAYGRITARTNRTITLPAKPATELPNIGAKDFSKSFGAGSYSMCSMTVKVSRDAYGRLTAINGSYSSTCSTCQTCDGN